MKLTVTPLERPSRVKRQGLHYHVCVLMDVLPKHVPTLVQCLVGQRTHLVGHCPMSYHYFHTDSTTRCIASLLVAHLHQLSSSVARRDVCQYNCHQPNMILILISITNRNVLISI